MLGTSAWWSMPSAVLALPCGSMSMTRTVSPAWARAAATLTVVVVLPTPPFWLATVRTRVAAGLGKTRPVSAMRLRASSATAWANGVSGPAPGAARRRSRPARPCRFT